MDTLTNRTRAVCSWTALVSAVVVFLIEDEDGRCDDRGPKPTFVADR
jgi:hypothetical protein